MSPVSTPDERDLYETDCSGCETGVAGMCFADAMRLCCDMLARRRNLEEVPRQRSLLKLGGTRTLPYRVRRNRPYC